VARTATQSHRRLAAAQAALLFALNVLFLLESALKVLAAATAAPHEQPRYRLRGVDALDALAAIAALTVPDASGGPRAPRPQSLGPTEIHLHL
jgi:hypothetical protein